MNLCILKQQRSEISKSAFAIGTDNFCLEVIRGHEISVSHIFFFWTSGLSLWASDLFHILAHYLVSKIVSVGHCRFKVPPLDTTCTWDNPEGIW